MCLPSYQRENNCYCRRIRISIAAGGANSIGFLLREIEKRRSWSHSDTIKLQRHNNPHKSQLSTIKHQNPKPVCEVVGFVRAGGGSVCRGIACVCKDTQTVPGRLRRPFEMCHFFASMSRTSMCEKMLLNYK